MSQHVASWKVSLELKPKLELFRNIKDTPIVENYCKVNLTRGQRSSIAKLRLGVLPIEIEIGRYNSIPREERICKVCQTGEIEDEKHFLLLCPHYDKNRRVLLDSATLQVQNFDEMNSFEKISILPTHENLVRKTGKFLMESLQERNDKLRLSIRA